ncbi:MAG: bifunctional DNA-binding transcriptional regulator/O6-methylguanine-DNA methyltransferase Ada [Acidobacteriota bacterium]|nr:bifunctional DNA-binding transcriptional regulator/O6-methylguanine-DNA methyltransferase Ada [Acidobacteriota bacterium]
MSGRLNSDAARREAVARRDARFDGAFVFGVRSTRIYCLPSCPARRPQPDRIVFFDGPETAERNGFRACRRCHPRQSAGGANHVAEHVARLCREIDRAMNDRPEERITLATLAVRSGIGASQLERIFRKHLSVTPRQYVDARRLRELKSRLRNGASVTEALYDAGYGSSSRLYERAPAQLGMTPRAYRRGGENMEIRYTVTPCPLGLVLVAATERGISALYLGDSKRKLESELRREFPRATISEDRKELSRWVGAIVEHLRGKQPKLDLPLDLQATAFERRVWEELRKIPYGTTRTYTEIARAIGKPRAVRAVARACAMNPASVVIPCHRVVRSDGQLAGYRWGLDRKLALLEKEKATKGERATR